jgi:hypothetical protein
MPTMRSCSPGRVRLPQARREKPRVSAFTSANIDKILALKPDLVLTFSDLQADIAADLIRRGLSVHAFPLIAPVTPEVGAAPKTTTFPSLLTADLPRMGWRNPEVEKMRGLLKSRPRTPKPDTAHHKRLPVHH